MNGFVRHVCWNPSDRDYFIKVEALTGTRASFLAVHTPVGALRFGGTRALPEGQATEKHLLEDLLVRRHAVVLVEGEPGSGKSHLIRWLGVRWPKEDRDHLVMVPRADGSLKGTLRVLVRELGKRYGEGFERLGASSDLSESGQAASILGKLSVLMRKSSYAEGVTIPPHQEFLDKYSAWCFLEHRGVKELWDAPAAIVRQMRGGVDRGDQASFGFEPGHVVDMVRAIRKVEPLGKPQGFDLKATRLLTEVGREIEECERLHGGSIVAGGWSAVASSAMPRITEFAAALEARRDAAIQGVLGVQPGELQARFQDARRALKADGKRLVLLLEDLTNLQGVDLQLVEALLPNPEVEGNEALCDLVAVIGITRRYYRQVFEGVGNIEDRLHLHINLSRTLDNIKSGEVSILAGTEDRARFVANYFNAVRLGKERVEEWYGAGGDIEARPNACKGCEHRERCHASFGAVDGVAGEGQVGLYPLSRLAVERFWENLREPGGDRLVRSPRGLLQNVVSEVLASASQLAEGVFPPPELLRGNEIEVIHAPPELRKVSRKISDADEARRLEDVALWWGTGDDVAWDKSEIGPGANVFAYGGVPQGVMAAFAVHWPGEHPVVHTEANDRLGPQPVPSAALPIHPPPPPRLGQDTAPSILPEPRPVPPVPLASPPRPPLAEKHQSLLKALDTWLREPGTGIAQAQEWDKYLFSCVSASRDSEGRSQPGWASVFTKENVTFGKPRMTGLQFCARPTQTLHEGLHALVWLRHANGLSREQRLSKLADLSIFQRSLAEEARAHVDARVTAWKAAIGGDPVEIGIRADLHGALLSGETAVRDPSFRYWGGAISTRRGGNEGDEPGLLGRDEKWGRLVVEWRRRHDRIIDLVRTWAHVGQQGKEGRGTLVDPVVVRDAVEAAMAEVGVWDVVLKGSLPAGLPEWLLLAEFVELLRTTFTAAVSNDFKRVKEQIRSINLSSGGQDAEAYVADVAKLIDRLRGLYSSELVGNDARLKWEQALDDARKQLGGAAGMSKRIRVVDEVLARLPEDEVVHSLTEQLEIALAVNAKDLAEVARLVRAALQVIEHAHQSAAVLIRSDSKSAAVADLDADNNRLRSLADAVRALGKERR